MRLSEPIPDESTILHFRHLLERHQLGQGLFEEIKSHLEEQGVRLREGTIVDATIIAAPSSTKNRTGQRDPEMRQTKKGNQYHFGMKLHTGGNGCPLGWMTGLVHSFSATSANVHDVTEAHRLLHGGERQVRGDAGYIGVQKRQENLWLAVDWQVAMRPSQRRKLEPDSAEALGEKVKASIRARVEHLYLDVKQIFGYSKVSYRGLSKNRERLALLLGLSNLRRARPLGPADPGGSAPHRPHKPEIRVWKDQRNQE